MLYKVGSKVVLKENFSPKTPAFSPTMNEFRGEVMSVINIKIFGTEPGAFYVFYEDPYRYWWHWSMIAGPAESLPPKLDEGFDRLLY